MKKRLSNIFLKVLIILVALTFLAPFYISFVYSFKTAEQITFTGLAFPKEFHFENFKMAIESSNFFRAFYNSLITTIPTVFLLTLICPMISYVIARRNNLFYNIVYYIFVAAILIPFQSIMLPLYIQLKNWGMLNTFQGNILVKTGFQIAFNILIFTGFVKSVPRNLEESANIDGAGPYRTYWQIVFPLLKPIIATSVILNTLSTWNDFTISVVVLMKDKVRTLPLMLYYFFGENSIELNLAFSAFTLAMIPMLILYFSLQKYIVSGVMMGSVKG